MSDHDINLTVNGRKVARRVPARRTLLDFLRADLGLTGTHAGCEHGVCGACTVMIDGVAMRSCLTFAVQMDGHAVTTVEGVANEDGSFHPVQQALHDNHGLQCGFCTPGIVMSLLSMTEGEQKASRAEILDAMSGHICRCTGYQGLHKAIAQLTEANHD
jgi:carbon-monoxide dehydrogenase small subunit